MQRFLTRVIGLALALSGLCAFAQETAPSAQLHPSISFDSDSLRAGAYGSGRLGLKPGSTGAPGSSIPFGIDYNRDAKALVVPLDQKSEWGMGVGLNLNSSKVIELSPSSVLGLQPANRAPGVSLHKNF